MHEIIIIKSFCVFINTCTSVRCYGCAQCACNKYQACLHMYPHASLISVFLSCGFKRVNASSFSSVTRTLHLVCLLVLGCGLSQAVQYISYSVICWMSIPRETFWINIHNHSGILWHSHNYVETYCEYVLPAIMISAVSSMSTRWLVFLSD